MLDQPALPPDMIAAMLAKQPVAFVPVCTLDARCVLLFQQNPALQLLGVYAHLA